MTQNADFTCEQVDITVPRGNAWKMECEIEDTDLTGRTFYGYVAEDQFADHDDYVAITVTPIDLVAGKLQISQTAATQGGYYYVNMKMGTDAPETILMGRFNLTEIGQKAP